MIWESRWRLRIAPLAAIVVLALVLAAAIVNFKDLLGTPPGSALPWLVPTLYVVIGLAGVLWGLVLSRSRPQVYSSIGGGTGCAETRVRSEEHTSELQSRGQLVCRLRL